MIINTKETSNLINEILMIFENDKEQLPEDLDSYYKKIFTAKIGLIYQVRVSAQKNYIMIGMGEKSNFDRYSMDKITIKLCNYLELMNINSFQVQENYLHKTVGIRSFVETIITSSYKFDQCKSKKTIFKIKQVDIIANNPKALVGKIKVGQAIGIGQNYAKTLKNLPTNICDTNYLLHEAKKMVKNNKKCTLNIVDEQKMSELGMGCITAVGRGSPMPSYIACMEYRGSKIDEDPVVLVGKGLVYDTGGLCLKPWQYMGDMKMDMGGAASVFGTMQAVTALNLPINVVGVVALVENSIDGRSYRPGDILKSMNGTTVEVGNTDAEGRLVLCDTLTYIKKYKPKVVINIATLTGAIVVSLGEALSGLFGNDEETIKKIKTASQESKDPVWEMPLFSPYKEKLKSITADICNIGGNEAGSITAALFLSNFTKEYKWAHLDVAGSAMKNIGNIGNQAGATGRPVPLLTQYLLNMS